MVDSERIVIRSICCSVIALLLCAAGAFVVYHTAYPELRALLVFRPTTGTVTHGEVASGPGRGRTHSADIQFTYRVDGIEYSTGRYRTFEEGDYESGATETVALYPLGTTHPAWFDPDDPSVAVLVRGVSSVSVLGLLLCGMGIVAPVWLWRLSRTSRCSPVT